MAGGEILHQSLAFLAADLGRKRKKRLGRRAGDAGGYFGILDVEPILVEKMGASARFHDVERDRHLVGRQLEVDVAVNEVEHHLRSEERRVGKESVSTGRGRGEGEQSKKKRRK